MAHDRTFVELNRASTDRIRTLVAHLSVVRALHRGDHLDDIDAALNQ